jgi:hypothetical protein
LSLVLEAKQPSYLPIFNSPRSVNQLRLLKCPARKCQGSTVSQHPTWIHER